MRFYVHPLICYNLRMKKSAESRWYRLDNVAKIFPGYVNGADTRVFRLSCELNEDVVPELLQKALDEALSEFPFYNCVLKKGLFWYYLDSVNYKPSVEEERLHACAPIYFPGRRNLLYRVNYYGNRINLEMFHVLADGNGGFRFLRRIVINYLRLSHDIPKKNRADRSSADEKTSDAFNKYYRSKKGLSGVGKQMRARAFQLKGIRDPNYASHLIEGCVSAKAFLEASHNYGVSAGIFMTALFIKAVMKEMSLSEMKYPIVISVPVDLRQYFETETARNFFGVVNIPFKAKSLDATLEEIIPAVKASFKEQLDKDKIVGTMNNYTTFEHNAAIRVVPLFIKEIALSIIAATTKKGVTATVSNLGRISLPDDVSGYVKQFSAFMSTQNTQVTVTTYGDNMTFGFCSPFEESDAALNFFRFLTDLGIEAVIASNDHDR